MSFTIEKGIFPLYHVDPESLPVINFLSGLGYNLVGLRSYNDFENIEYYTVTELDEFFQGDRFEWVPAKYDNKLMFMVNASFILEQGIREFELPVYMELIYSLDPFINSVIDFYVDGNKLNSKNLNSVLEHIIKIA